MIKKIIAILLFLTVTSFAGIIDNTGKPLTIVSKSASEPVIEDSSLTNGLCLWYKMDENSWDGSAGEVKDSSGNSNHGTSYGGAQTNPGKLGRAGYFDGVNDYVSSLSTSSVHPTNSFTLCGWIKPSNQGSLAGTMVSLPNRGYAIHYSTTTIYFDIPPTSNTYLRTTVNTTTPLGEWHHIVGMYENGSFCKIYKDGVILVTNTNSIPSSLYANSFPLHIGNRTDKSEYFTGSIDDVRIYNRALSSNEVYNLFNATGKDKKPKAIYQGNKLLYNPRKLNYKREIFNPLSIPDCVLWLDATDLSVLSDGALVSSWPDKSGNGNTATQSDTQYQPSKSGRTVVFSAASSKFLRTQSLASSSGALTVIVACSRPSWGFTTGLYRCLWSYGYGLINQQNYGSAVYCTDIASEDCPANSIIVFGRGYPATQYPRAVSTAFSPASSGPHIICARLSPTVSEIDIDDSPSTYVSHTGNIGAAENQISIGADNVGREFWDGGINEMLVWFRALTDEEEESVCSYMNAKWR